MGRCEGAGRTCRRGSRCRIVAVVLLVVLAGLSGCGREDGVDVARPAEPSEAGTPYAGPLYVGLDDARNATDRETGAAGQIVQCTTRVTGDFRPGRYEGGETGPTPKVGLQTAFDEGYIEGPQQGYLLERQEGDRVLFTYRIDGVVKVATVLLNGPAQGAPAGWHLESWARCDPSEFRDEELWADGWEIWTDTEGRRVPTYEVFSARGPEHCDWTAMTFLRLGDNEEQAYVRRAWAEYVGDHFAEPYRAAVELPGDAIDTGYRREGRHLWLSPDRKRAYVGAPGAGSVELWPRMTQPLQCD